MVKYSDVRKLSLVHTTGIQAETPAERFTQKERSELRTVDRVFFTNIREETRKADKCGLIRIDNNLYQIPKAYAEKISCIIRNCFILFRVYAKSI